jgi:hypothetical protein
MKRMHVRDSRIIFSQKFVTPSKTFTAVTREYLLPDDTIVFEQYVLWQAETVDVVMIGVREVESYRYTFSPRW